MKRVRSIWIVYAALIALLSACSSKDVNKPTKLVPLKYPLKISKQMDVSVGTGDDELALSLVPYIAGTYAYVIDTEGDLVSVNTETGKRELDVETGERVSAGLGGDSKHLYYVTFQGELVCLNRVDGSEVWRSKLTSEGVSAPVSDGSLVVTQTIDGKVFGFNTAQGIKSWQFDSVGPLLSLRGTSRPLMVQGRTLASFANGEMVALDNQNGFPAWKSDIGVAQGRTELERLIDVDGNAVYQSGVIYAIAYQGKLVAIDLYSGREIWSEKLSSYSGVAVDRNQIYVSDENGQVIALSRLGGKESWVNEDLKYRRLDTPVVWQTYVVVSDLEGYIHVLNTESGKIVGRIRPDRDGVMHMQVRDNLLYVYTRSGDYIAYSLPDISL